MKIRRVTESALAGCILLIPLFLGGRALSQTKKYELTEIQKLRLQVKLDNAKLAQQSLSAAQQQFNAAIAAFNAQVADTEKENSWPATLRVDPNTLDFTDAPAAAETKPVPSKAPAAPPVAKKP
jgi:hypothetical protein